MKMKFFALALSLMLMVTGSAMAENYYNGYMNLPEDSLEQAKAAVMAQLPQAVIDHAQLDYDDRRFEWDIFYTRDGMLGVCEVNAESYKVIRTKEYPFPADALVASKAIEALKQAKGSLSIVDIDLDRDNGRVVYEGEAELDGRFYEFEMTADGQIIEWERD
ncbi:MAG: PepSY domain-containing protein [Clostridia bacterium]|nr:PepSY domain-containing protein [Clostridia bacterium]